MTSNEQTQWIGAEVSSVLFESERDIIAGHQQSSPDNNHTNNHSIHENCSQSNNNPSHNFLRNVLPPSAKGSLLHSIINNHLGNSNQCIRGVVFGPSQCGKTSLAMDLAHAICSNDTRNACTSSSGSNSHEMLSASSDDDQFYHSVVFVVHSSKRDNPNRGFPARCCSLDSMQSGYANGFNWNIKALNRVQIKYVSSLEDVLKYLMSIQVLSAHERPLGGIIIDDLHLVLERETPQDSRKFMDSTIEIIKVLACLEDTATFLDAHRYALDGSHSNILNQQKRSALLVTLDTTMINIPFITRSLFENWLEIPFTIQSKKSDASETLWTINMRSSLEHQEDKKESAHYSISEIQNKGLVLSWSFTTVD